jgi:formate hydrogenlyase transcriptional activator
VQLVPERHSGPEGQLVDGAAKRYEALLRIADAAATKRIPDLLRDTAKSVVSLFPLHLLAHSLHMPYKNLMLLQRLDLHSDVRLRPLELPVESLPSGWVWKHQKPLCLKDLSQERRFPQVVGTFRSEGMRSLIVLPMTTPRARLGALVFGSREAQELEAPVLDFLFRITGLIALAMENSLTNGGMAEYRQSIREASGKNGGLVESGQNFDAIIGESPALKRVLQRVDMVARSNTTVLVTGETGTGKELIARAIHRLSQNCHGRFVHLNCAAIPTGLLESELFGHEKGAFTGASSQKIGRLEIADHGTLFLDEIGEIPLELQPKLLRALQGQEFERLGGTKTLQVNARVIAATNCDLEEAIAQHQFRSDLYYRLNVFPIHVPPLRERLEDLRALVEFFVQKFETEMQRSIEPIAEDVIARLRAWHWPGNIRELENFIERSVLLSREGKLRPPFAELQESEMRKSVQANTLKEVEREYIVRTLRMVRGVISGTSGAAAKLGMKRTTLQSKILRLGILPSEYKS